MPNAPKKMPKQELQIQDLLCQAIETELGGVAVYENALRAVLHDDLRREWTKYLEQTRNHVRVLREVFDSLDMDADMESAGRTVVRHQGKALVHAIAMALRDGTPEAAQLVAAECVVLAETKDHQNWELLGELVKQRGRDLGGRLASAWEEVEDEEDEHLYHSKGWARELWLASLGLPAVLPPPEEQRDVHDAIEAAQAKDEREEMLRQRGPAQSFGD